MAGAARHDAIGRHELGGARDTLTFELADAGDDAELRDLLREIPLPGWVTLAYEREPDYFLGATIEGETHETILARARATGELVGTFTRSVHRAFLDGAVKPLGYLGLLRLSPRHRGRIAHLRNGFEFCRRELHADGSAPFYLTSIVASNRTARRVLTAGLPGLPAYRPLEAFSTLALPCRRLRPRGRSAIRIVRASPADLGEVASCLQRNYVRYQCAPYWSVRDLGSSERCRGLRPEDFLLAIEHERVVGCAAVWDQRGFKQHVVKAYTASLARWRGAINGLAPLLSLPKLPDLGEQLRQAYISHVAVDNDDAEVLARLVTAALDDAAARGLSLLALGLSSRNPLLAAVKRRFRHLEYRSLLYLVHWTDGEEAVRRLDERVVHVEAATL